MKDFLFFYLFLYSLSSFSQFEKNYVPIKYTGTIPSYFLASVEEKVNLIDKAGLLNIDGVSKDEAKSFYGSLSTSLSAQLLSSNIYFNDEISDYVNKVGQKLLTNSKYQSFIRFYVARFNSVNAVCWGEGTIIVNIGLLSRLNNEAELAFILSHEIAHFMEDHSSRSFKLSKKLETDFLNKDRMLKAIMEAMRFSREQEYEADLEGFTLFSKSGYNLMAAVSALRMLENSSNEKYAKEISWASVFNEKIDEKDSSLYFISYDDFQKRKNTKRVNVSYDSDDEEEFSTHPDISRRISQILKLVKDTTDTQTNLFLVSNHSDFERLKVIADFEQIETNLSFLYFPRAIYLSFQLLEVYPENEYLHQSIVEGLFFMTYYKKVNGYKNIAPKFNNVSNYSYGSFLKYFESRNTKNMIRLVLPWMEQQYELYPSNGEIMINIAKMYDLDGDNFFARKWYKEYCEKFPKGRHYYYANHQIEKIKNEK